jgi:hypothetical protein
MVSRKYRLDKIKLRDFSMLEPKEKLREKPEVCPQFSPVRGVEGSLMMNSDQHKIYCFLRDNPDRAFSGSGVKKEIDLEMKDIFDPTAYKRSDVFIAVDLIHHFTPEKLKGLFDLIFSYAAKKVIIMEASFSPMKRYGILGKVAEWIFKSLDTDGINKIERVMTNQEYRQLFESRFGSRYGEKFDFQYQLVGGRCLYQLVTYTHVAG